MVAGTPRTRHSRQTSAVGHDSASRRTRLTGPGRGRSGLSTVGLGARCASVSEVMSRCAPPSGTALQHEGHFHGATRRVIMRTINRTSHDVEWSAT